jgi:BirA family biotin operon repressor/biotin-[acetyl-CoA-carboxylase] ligase
MAKKHDIIWLDTVDSTNEEVRRRISDLDNLSVVSAFSQSAGRGQRGNTWSAKAGENLTFSILARHAGIRALDQFVISEITALSVVDLLAIHGINARIKWPNDIYVGDRKICGILIENSLKESFVSTSIIGIGLNVNQTCFDPSLPNPTSMALSAPSEEPGPSYDLKYTLEDFMEIFSGYCRRYLNITGGYARLRKLYLAQLWRKDEPAKYVDTSTGLGFTGIIRGLSDIGHLIVEDTEKGELKEFAFKEIGYII